MPSPPDHLATLSQTEWEEPIYIPEAVRILPLQTIPLSLPTRYFLGCHDFWRAGNLHGLSLMDLRRLRWCDLGTLAEVLHLVRTLQQTDDQCQEKIREFREARRLARLPKVKVPFRPPPKIRPPRNHWKQPASFNVPEPIRALPFWALPLSARLQHLLAAMNLHCLGELHDWPHRRFQAVRNCGVKTVAELERLIERAVAGEFFPPTTAPAEVPAELIRCLDALLAQLPKRNREILQLRLVGQDGRKATLEAIAQKFGMTRERVRQIVRTSLDCLRRDGSVRLRWLWEQMAARCLAAGRPLTAERLGEWLPADAGQFSPAFYVRLLEQLPDPSAAESGGLEAV